MHVRLGCLCNWARCCWLPNRSDSLFLCSGPMLEQSAPSWVPNSSLAPPCPAPAPQQASPALRTLLERVVLLYALYRTEQDLGWLLSEEMLTPAAGRAVSAALRTLCAELAPHYTLLVDSFGIPEHLVCAPIAADWERYNEVGGSGWVVIVMRVLGAVAGTTARELRPTVALPIESKLQSLSDAVRCALQVDNRGEVRGIAF